MDHPGLLTAITTAPDFFQMSLVLPKVGALRRGFNRAEAKTLVEMEDWRGTIHETGRFAYPINPVIAPPKSQDQVENPDILTKLSNHLIRTIISISAIFRYLCIS